MLHRFQNITVAADPRKVICPAASFDMESLVLALQIRDHFLYGFRAVSVRKTIPDTLLKDRLNHWKILAGDTELVQIFEIFGDVQWRDVRAGRFAHDFEVFRRKLIHHDAAILAV